MNEERTTQEYKFSVYTFKVEMVVQVIAQSEREADMIVDEQGGVISLRKVTLLSNTDIINNE